MMNYTQFTLTEKHSLDANALSDEYVHRKIIPPDRKSLYENIPEFLGEFADKDSWLPINLDEVLHSKFRKTISNLYIDEVLLKAHDPNLIFDIIRDNLIDTNYLAFKIITAENIKFDIKNRLSPVLFPFYYPFHFLSRRVLPKLKGCRKICRLLAIPVDITKAEIIGRLIYKGFEIVDIKETAHETTIITKVDIENKIRESKPVPKEGFLFSMNRVGENGKGITVYKFRSMHPYAEYVQEFLHKKNGLDAGGKFKNDFRVSTGGRIIRKYWIDELPMIYNLLKGDIKLIGVRPISEHYFSLYPVHAQVVRRKHKPGLIPPFYADMPNTFDEIVQSELNYLNQYEDAPLRTDVNYLFRILKNIVVHKARSK